MSEWREEAANAYQRLLREFGWEEATAEQIGRLLDGKVSIEEFRDRLVAIQEMQSEPEKPLTLEELRRVWATISAGDLPIVR